MTMLINLLTFLIFLLTAYPIHLTAAEPVQFCKYGSVHAIDFCMGLTTHVNATTNAHDLYLSIKHTRYEGSSHGWTAIGIGNEMAGSLMFIIYGDPLGDEPPIISIRGSTGHVQPQLITRETSGGLDMRVLRSQWIPSIKSFTPDQPNYEARVSIVCYSCHLWTGSKIEVQATAQPWIWAWNEKQKFDVFSYDAHLDMHKHHAGAGGWGQFYVDMARSINAAPNPPSLPPIRAGAVALGVSESPLGDNKLGFTVGILVNPAWHLHGFLMGFTFLVLFPIGTISIRSGLVKSFKYHWVLQLFSSILTVLGALTGLLLSKRIYTYHQVQGLAILGFLVLQSILGWRHHIDFLRFGHGTWIRHVHIWMGRLVLIFGWTNLVTGFVLRDYPSFYLFIMFVAIGFDLVGVAIFLWLKYPRQQAAKKHVYSTISDNRVANGKDYFALTGDESDGEAADDSGIEKRFHDTAA